jgi:hypothetical protein
MKKEVSKLKKLVLLRQVVDFLYNDNCYVYNLYDEEANSPELWIYYNQPSVIIDPRIVSMAGIMELEVNVVYSRHKDRIVIKIS